MSGGSRRALLVAALGFVDCHASPREPALEALRSWLSSWRGVGLTGASGSAFETTPFRAVQIAAWETLARA